MWSWVETSSVCSGALEHRLHQGGSHLAAIVYPRVIPLLTICGLPPDPRGMGSSHSSLLAKGISPEKKEALSYCQPALAATEKRIWAGQNSICDTHAYTHIHIHMHTQAQTQTHRQNTQGINTKLVRWLLIRTSLRLRRVVKVGFSFIFAFLIITICYISYVIRK